MAKQSKNQVALQSNEQALDKARADLVKAQTTVQKLTVKIPELERAVSALQVLCGEKLKTVKPLATFTTETSTGLPLPTELLTWKPPEDLNGISSIPAPREATPKPTMGNVAQEIKREGGFA